MSDLVAIAYPDEFMAAEVLVTLRRLQHEDVIDLEDTAYITKDVQGAIKLHESRNVTAAGAVGDGVWGRLVGMLLFAPIAGNAVDADAGVFIDQLSNYGLSADFARQLASELPRSSSAIFILTRTSSTERALPELAKFGGAMLRTSLSIESEAQLRAALSSTAQDMHAPNVV